MGHALLKKAILLLKMANVWFDLLIAVCILNNYLWLMSSHAWTFFKLSTMHHSVSIEMSYFTTLVTKGICNRLGQIMHLESYLYEYSSALSKILQAFL